MAFPAVEEFSLRIFFSGNDFNSIGFAVNSELS